MFKNGWNLYVFNLTNSQEDSQGFELVKDGCTTVQIRFSSAVPAGGITLIAYAETDGLILIDRSCFQTFYKFILKIFRQSDNYFRPDNIMNQTNKSIITPDVLPIPINFIGPDILPIEAPMPPIACFAEMGDTSTKSWVICTVYFLAIGVTTAVGFYYYITRKKPNGHPIHRQTTV